MWKSSWRALENLTCCYIQMSHQNRLQWETLGNIHIGFHSTLKLRLTLRVKAKTNERRCPLDSFPPHFSAFPAKQTLFLLCTKSQQEHVKIWYFLTDSFEEGVWKESEVRSDQTVCVGADGGFSWKMCTKAHESLPRPYCKLTLPNWMVKEWLTISIVMI